MTYLIKRPASQNRIVGPLIIFDYSVDFSQGNITSKEYEEIWKEAYDDLMEKKYHRSSRNFTRKISGKEYIPKGKKKLPPGELPPIYLIARERGGPSYKQVDLVGSDSSELMFMPISKGYSMQGVSSFSLGPIVGEGLCLINSAFSKAVCLFHLVGGGRVDLKRKNFWRKGKALRDIEVLSDTKIKVDGKVYRTERWLEKNKELWFKVE
jgi:hypothetical protein